MKEYTENREKMFQKYMQYIILQPFTSNGDVSIFMSENFSCGAQNPKRWSVI